jgi:hypothetical protein
MLWLAGKDFQEVNNQILQNISKSFFQNKVSLPKNSNKINIITFCAKVMSGKQQMFKFDSLLVI